MMFHDSENVVFVTISLQFDQMTWVVLLWIIILPIESDPICIGDLGIIAAIGHAAPISVELVVVAAAATVHKPSASLGHRVLMVHRYIHSANSGLRCHPADRIQGINPGLRN